MIMLYYFLAWLFLVIVGALIDGFITGSLIGIKINSRLYLSPFHLFISSVIYFLTWLLLKYIWGISTTTEISISIYFILAILIYNILYLWAGTRGLAHRRFSGLATVIGTGAFLIVFFLQSNSKPKFNNKYLSKDNSEMAKKDLSKCDCVGFFYSYMFSSLMGNCIWINLDEQENSDFIKKYGYSFNDCQALWKKMLENGELNNLDDDGFGHSHCEGFEEKWETLLSLNKLDKPTGYEICCDTNGNIIDCIYK